MLDCQDHEVCIESATRGGGNLSRKGPAFYGTSKRSLAVNLAKSCSSKSLHILEN